MPEDTLTSKLFRVVQGVRDSLTGVTNKHIAQSRLTRTPIEFYEGGDPNIDGMHYNTSLGSVVGNLPTHIRIRTDDPEAPPMQTLAHELTHEFVHSNNLNPADIVGRMQPSPELGYMKAGLGYYPQGQIPDEVIARTIGGQNLAPDQVGKLRQNLLDTFASDPVKQKLLQKFIETSRVK